MRTIGKFKVEYSFRNTINSLKIVTTPLLCILESFLKKYKCINNVKTKLSFLNVMYCVTH